MTRSRAALTMAVLAVLAAPAILFAHARLTKSEPAADARLERPPQRITLWFSERPELRFTSVQLLDSTNASIALNPVAKVAGDASAVVTGIASPMAAGRYTVVWQTAASDGHPSRGSYSFRVLTGADTTRAVPTPAAAPARQPAPNQILSAPIARQPLNAAEHWALLVAVLTVIGAIVFRGAVLTRARWNDAAVLDGADRARQLARAALALALIASLTRLAAETSLMPGAPMGMRTMWEVARDTAWGHGWLVGAAGMVVTALALTFAWRTTAGWIAAAAGAVALAASQSLTGHAGAERNSLALSVSVDIVHTLAAGAWIGGLVAIVLAGLPGLRRLDEAERATFGSSLVRAYHDVALPGLIIVALTGVTRGWLRIGGLSALVSSAYGRVLMTKVALVLVLAVFGYYHWRTVVRPSWVPESAGRFRRTALLELLAGALVLTATALLVSMATPDAAIHAH
jgi:copper transport protein